MSNKIVKRYYIAADMELVTPLAVSSGEDSLTDADVLRDADGRPFIPGTSLAGALRNYIGKNKNEDCSFGYSSGNEEQGRMSSIFISDAYIEAASSAVRDAVSLNEQKNVSNKFDFEVIESGKATLRFEKLVREKDTDDTPEEFSKLLSALDEGEIRLGANKNRGCGWVKIKRVYKKEFSQQNLDEWLLFCKNTGEDGLPPYSEADIWSDWKKSVDSLKYITFRIPLKLKGTISIRRYSAKPGKDDYEHITVKEMDGKEIPVIPGSSWNGVIRSGIRKILTEVKAENKEYLIRDWFGYVENEARQSNIVIKESRLEDASAISLTRNKINRFDASTVDGALYSERTYYGGTTELEIKIRKKGEYEALAGMLFLIAEEIRKGYLAVGGLTAIGRGIFEANGEVEVQNVTDLGEYKKKCMKALVKGIGR